MSRCAGGELARPLPEPRGALGTGLQDLCSPNPQKKTKKEIGHF